MLDEKIIEIIKNDIERCKQQTVNNGSYELYQSLMGKYNGLFPGFSDDIPQSGKISVGGPFNYRPELNAIKEKLELMIVVEQNRDPLFKFKEMVSDDIAKLKKIFDDYYSVGEKEKLKFYKSLTAKYHPYVPRLGEGLYGYYASRGFYDDVGNSSLEHNLTQIYNKLTAFKSLNYPGLGASVENAPSTVVNITNKNENNNALTVTFDAVRDKVNEMTSLPDEDIEEIQKKITELEEIVKSKESKSKKWSKAKNIIKWVADKGVDVGITLLPLILNIG